MHKTRRRFLWDDNQPPLHYRPGTSDEGIIQEVIVEARDYLFPKLGGIKTVFDIGSNIGVAAVVLAQLYPDAVIHCFEPQPDNFELLKMNTEHLGARVVLNEVALGNRNDDRALLYASDNPINLGGFSTQISQDPSPKELDLEYCKMVRATDYLKNGICPDLIKIDCEGGEFDILEDMQCLSRVAWVTGELHRHRPWDTLSILSKTHHIQTAKSLGDSHWAFTASHKDLVFPSLPLVNKVC